MGQSTFQLNQIYHQQLSNDATISGLPLSPLNNNPQARSFTRIKIQWYLSLSLSFVCGIGANLIKLWARRYLQLTRAETALHRRARTRQYLFEGVQAFGVHWFANVIPVLYHVVIFLFFSGLVEDLLATDPTVGHVVLYAIVYPFGGIYAILTILPITRPNCPYRTPFSQGFMFLLAVPTIPVLLAICGLCYFIPVDKSRMIRNRILRFMRSSLWTTSDVLQSPLLQEETDRRALRWAVETIDDVNMETFIEGVPEFIEAGTSRNALSIVQELLDLRQPKPLGHQINRLMPTCTADGYRGPNENLRKSRALKCLDTLRYLIQALPTPFSYEMFGDQTWPSVHSLERDEDPVVAINAIATGALAACKYLVSVFESRGQTSNQAPNQMIRDTHVRNLYLLVNARWREANLNSFPDCHLIVIQAFVSSLLPYLRSGKVAPTSFRMVQETLRNILDIEDPSGHPIALNPQLRESFWACWQNLTDLSNSWPDDDTSDMLPIRQLTFMLRETTVRIQGENSQYDQNVVVPGAASGADVPTDG